MQLKKALPLLFLVGLAGTASLAETTPGFARSSYDGSWRVLVVADPGHCSDHFAVALRVANGHVSYVGMLGQTPAGKVSNNGAISLAISDVRASGALFAATGTGRWRSSTCNGSWTARKA